MTDRMPTQSCASCGKTISTTRCPFCHHEHFNVSRATSAEDTNLTIDIPTLGVVIAQELTSDIAPPDTLPADVTPDTPFEGGDSGGAGASGSY